MYHAGNTRPMIRKPCLRPVWTTSCVEGVTVPVGSLLLLLPIAQLGIAAQEAENAIVLRVRTVFLLFRRVHLPQAWLVDGPAELKGIRRPRGWRLN